MDKRITYSYPLWLSDNPLLIIPIWHILLGLIEEDKSI